VPVHDLGDDLCGGLVCVPAVEVLGGQRLRGHWASIGSWIEESGFPGTSGGRIPSPFGSSKDLFSERADFSRGTTCPPSRRNLRVSELPLVVFVLANAGSWLADARRDHCSGVSG
jgi:hypothetical protein